MADTAARLAIVARRNEVLRFTIVVIGIDLTGVDMKMQVRLAPGDPGLPNIQLGTVNTLAAEGLKLDSVTVANGVSTSVIKGRVNQATMSDVAKVPFAAEQGVDSVLAYAMQWTLNGDANTRIEGSFIVRDSAYGSDSAPATRPKSDAISTAAVGANSGTLTFGDQVIAVTIAAADLVGIEVAKIQATAVSASAAAELAGHYSNDSGDLDISGAPAGARGAKFWSLLTSTIAAKISATYALVDTAGDKLIRLKDTAQRLIFDLDRDASKGARFYVPVNFVPGTISSDALDPATQARLPFSIVDDVVGYVFRLKDTAGRMILGVPKDANQPIAAYVLRAALADNAGAPLAVNASYVVTAAKDGAGVVQLTSERRADGRRTVLTTAAQDSIGPLLTSDDKVVFSRAGATLWTPAGGGGAVYPLAPTPDVVWWGDSLTQVDGGANSPAAVLATLLGRAVYNGGAGGQTTSDILARQGGSPMLVALAGGQIPADTSSVVVTARTSAIAASCNPITASLPGPMTGTIAGVPVRVTRNVDGNGAELNYSIARLTAGAAVPVPAGTPFLPDIGISYQNSTLILWVGRNDFNPALGYDTAAARVKAGLAAAIAFYKPFVRHILILGVTNKGGGTENLGSANLGYINQLNAELAATYGDSFINIRRVIIEQGLALAGIAPTAQDTADIANDVPPSSLRGANDDTHFTALCISAVIAPTVRDRFTAKGY